MLSRSQPERHSCYLLGQRTNGYTITTSASPLIVSSGACVSNIGTSAITVAIPANATGTQRTTSITVNGTVSAIGAAGILLTSGAANGSSYDFNGLGGTAAVAQGAAVSGTTEITLSRNSGTYSVFAPIYVTVDNAGTLTGTSGAALSNTGGSTAQFTTITNRATGTTGAIAGSFGIIQNDGLIDGGSMAAIDTAGGYLTGTVNNTGTIRSANGVATIANTFVTLTNSGTIANTGGGKAIGSTSWVSLTNKAGGSITANGAATIAATGNLTLGNAGTITNSDTGGTTISGGSVSIGNLAGGVISAPVGGNAITATYSLGLTNAGTINGDILASAAYGGSSIDSTAGVINGNVVLGSGNDTLVANYSNGALITGITGTIDGGAGNNTLKVNFTTDATLFSALAMPIRFNLLTANVSKGATVTLGRAFTTGGTITLDGSGTVVNQASLTSATQVFTTTGYPVSLTKQGSITTTASGNYAVVVQGGGTFTNNGTVTAAGNGVQVWGSFVNSGTITAAQTGFTQYSGSFKNNGTISGGTAGVVVNSYGYSFVNSGAISSSSGTGLSLSGSSYGNSALPLNSGTISGVTGISLSGLTFNNSGAISGTTGAMLASGATLINLAGGSITGTAYAVNNNGYSDSLVNAGTITGNVNLASSQPSTASNYAVYVAQSGGVLNGNLTLGLNDTLVTALSGAGTSGYAGINGTVNASNSTLRYAVEANASDVLAAHGGFTTLGYQLSNNAVLSLFSNGSYDQSLVLAGTGTVNSSASIATTNASALISSTIIQPGTNNAYVTQPSTALTIANSSMLAMNRTSTSAYPIATVQLGSSDSFTNTGTVSLTDTSGSSSIEAALVGGSSITNSGTISALGGYGINAAYSYSPAASSITNSGTIRSNLAAIALSYGTSITNSGAISSTTGAAVLDLNGYGYSDKIVNLAGGTISGVGAAIQMSGGTVSNAGTINGNVNLAYSPYGYSSYNSGVYVANGGTLNGNLIFGGGTDMLVETGSGYGVIGTIDGGSGTNWVEHLRNGTATVTLGGTLPTNFTSEAVVADTTAAQITLTGPANYTDNVYVGGSGTIINQQATTGTITGLSAAPATTDTSSYLTRFSNRANIGGLSLAANALDNTAIIGSAGLTGSAVYLSSNAGVTFSNSGAIFNGGDTPAVSFYAAGNTGNTTIANSGTIAGGMGVNIYGGADTTVSITNSGTISSFSQTYLTYDPTNPPYFVSPVTYSYALIASAYGPKSLSLTNSGMIAGNIDLSGTNVTLANSGTITGNISTGAGDDNLTLGGVVTGNISTGTGNDSIALNGVFSGNVDGGKGANTLSIDGGSQSAPVAITSASNFATLTQTGGFATVSGVGVFGNVALTGGRLVGLAGSVLNAASFNVGSNATFGSAGTVNGNVVVSGILSPGASPGTMTVTGNVTLNSGSTSLFEITPTVSDKLIVNGKMAILPGSTLQIAASAPVKVGSTLDLITASGGVSGSYDTITGLAGSLRTLANGDLGLLVQFANPESYNPQLRRAISYVNTAMAASSAPAALTSALSALQDGNGAPIAAAFARLTPEPYADALQIGAETALSLAGNARTIGEGEANGATHLFGFGQGLGSLRQFASRETQGVSHATINGFGALGGIGVAGQGYAVTAYVGWIDESQSISALSASTKARGVVGGVVARFGGATRITLSANYDAAHALTRRYVPDAGTISTAYALPSWSFDASISHAVPLGQGWVARPQVGTTWVTTSHDPINEASAHPFALTVNEAGITQGFADAGLGFETAPDAKGPWRCFLTLGGRYRVEGEQTAATAALAGYYSSSLAALGVGRNRVDATMAASVEYRLAPGASLFLNASGELGKASKRESVAAGVRFRL